MFLLQKRVKRLLSDAEIGDEARVGGEVVV